MSVYLTGSDPATYGVPTASAPQILQASGIVDGYLKRLEGLVFTPDFLGQPCFMAGATPKLTFTLTAPIAPGPYAVCSVTGGFISTDLIGEVLIADRANTEVTEALVVSAVNPAAGQITVGFPPVVGQPNQPPVVAAAHSTGALLESGLVIVEERALPSKRSVTRVAKFPVQRVISGIGRYGYGRRSDQVAGLFNDTNLLAALETFGGPPAWFAFRVDQVSVSAQTGELWIPAGLLLAYYSDARIGYVAGYSAANIPENVKIATALIIGILQDTPDLGAKSYKAGGTAITRWGDSAIPGDVKDLLNPWRARAFI